MYGQQQICLKLIYAPNFLSHNAHDRARRSALHYAAREGLTDVCSALVSHPLFTVADLIDAYGRTACETAKHCGHTSTADLLAS
eukprot:5394195-Amphidinium_carterae.1